MFAERRELTDEALWPILLVGLPAREPVGVGHGRSR